MSGHDENLEQERWQAVQARRLQGCDPFVYAVKTTGIYCLPGCASRLPHRENVEFFDTTKTAAAAGFRACKRCRPDESLAVDPHTEVIRRACETIIKRDNFPGVDTLAKQARLSPSHFRQVFKQQTGVTVQQFADAVRRRRLHQNLGAPGSITNAIFEAGYQSVSRVYEKIDALLGMSPSIYRAGGSGIKITYATGTCTLGHILVAVTPRGVCAIELGDCDDELITALNDQFPAAETAPDADLIETLDLVITFLETPALGLDLPLDIQGTAFQQRVWEALQCIPAGETRTYSEVAEMIGSPTSVRAVASACARNKLAVAVPCHRVIGSDGRLAGYRWGVDRKRLLLERERGDK